MSLKKDTHAHYSKWVNGFKSEFFRLFKEISEIQTIQLLLTFDWTGPPQQVFCFTITNLRAVAQLVSKEL